MRYSLFSAVLAVSGAAAQSAPNPFGQHFPPPPEDKIPAPLVKPITLDEAKATLNVTKPLLEVVDGVLELVEDLIPIKPVVPRQNSCANPRVRREWDSYSNSDRQAYVDAIKCLMTRPASGQFRQARNRYEDLVALHQTLTPNVHNNAKFLVWHRYYLWVFEDLLRTECGFNRDLPWWDEARYSGRFAQSSIFSNQWFGGIALNGGCVTTGQFANLGINVGPGTDNFPHCLARHGDAAKTREVNQGIVDTCNRNGGYAAMANCAEGGAHAWGHNGIGSVMQDPYASPADPVFFLHHAYIDRNFRVWQNADRNRLSYIDGTDRSGARLTLDTRVNVYGIRPDVTIREILDTTARLCYRYSY